MAHNHKRAFKTDERIKTYIDARNVDFNVKHLKYMIFGHTHHPVPWNDDHIHCPQFHAEIP